MTERTTLRDDIAACGAVLEGQHFFALKKQGNVSTKYINMDPVFTRPKLVTLIGRLLMAPWDTRVDAIVGPAVGGIPLIYAAAKASTREVETAWADKQEGKTFAFERMGFAKAVKGKHVLVLEDIVSSGESARSVASLVHDAYGHVVGGSIIWNRGKVTAEDAGVPKLHSLIEESVETWKVGEHEMWGKWPLVTDVGHPEHYPDYPGPRIKLL